MPPTGAVLPCQSCHSTRLSILYPAPAFDTVDKTVFTLTRCEKCGLTRTEPIFTDQELARHYPSSYYGSGLKKFTGVVEWLTRLDSQRRANRLLSLLRAHEHASFPVSPRILDIGCGRANLLAALARQGCECHGVERQDFPFIPAQPGIYFYRDALENLNLAPASFDAIVLWHVLEHVSNPAATLEIAVRLLRSGGILALAVPNFGGWQARLFKSAWFHLDLPRHTHHFCQSALQRLLNEHHLKIIKIGTWAFDQNVFGFVQSLLNALAPTNRANELYSLLKNSYGIDRKLRLLAWLSVAGIITPLALLEYLFAGLHGKGASLIMYASKLPSE